MEAVKAEKLTKKYKDITAVDGLDLSVEKGELFSLLGVNGAGKTTAIRMFTCLSEPTEGDAFILGHSVTEEPEKVKRLIGISTQDTAVAEKLTVYENLRFMTELYADGERTYPDRKTEELIGMFSMEEVRDRKASALSGGWQRKLSIAMALAGDPEVLFLDEPTLGLDVLARRELWSIIGSFKGKKTVILTTHYMEEAEALSDRIAVMIKGKLRALGTLEELEEMTGRKGLEEVFVALAEGKEIRS